MAFGDGVFRTGAASLLRSSTPSTVQAQGANHEKPPSSPLRTPPSCSVNEKTPTEAERNNLEKSRSPSSRGKTYHSSGPDAVAHDREAQRIVREIPPWVHTLAEGEENLITEPHWSPITLLEAQVAQHNSNPSPNHHPKSNPPRDKLYDHERGWDPPLSRGANTEPGSRWRAFAEASAYPILQTESRRTVDQEWLTHNGPDYSRPWLADAQDGDPEKNSGRYFRYKARRRAWYIRAQHTVLRNSIVPLIIRMNVFFFSAVALALAGSIHHRSTEEHLAQTASTDMAIIVDVVAMIYLLYITYDEYTGKPLGLRSAKAKMRLIFLDLFFIVFDSANLSLAFEAIGYGDCFEQICSRQKALASVLLIALIAWLLTFGISVLRLVERVTGR